MAKIYVGVNRGAGPGGVTASTSTTGRDLEVVIDDTKILSRDQAYGLLEHIEAHIATPRAWPLA